MSITSIDIKHIGIKLIRLMANIASESKGVHWVQVVQEQVGAIRFGVVQITIHESRVVQVERTEKVRFDRLGGHDQPVAGKAQIDSKQPCTFAP
jgi:hypothetical protein